MSIKLLLVEDDLNSLNSLKKILEEDGYFVFSAMNIKEALSFINEEEVDIIISDMILPDFRGSEILNYINENKLNIPIIFFTGFATIEDAVKQIKSGAFDYITKPIDIRKLEISIERAIESQKLKNENLFLKEELKKRFSFNKIIGKSYSIQQILRKIEKIADTNATILIRGESGTGKELIAEAIHYNSSRADRKFVAVNCAALAETLIESELFGHEKGAFTGAIKKQIGKFELANGGTLFLDEIGDISISTQLKLLRVLEEKKFQRVGGNEDIKVDIRLIAATNKNLEEEIKKGNFREELYYRIKVVSIEVPPLRERKEDIPLLANYFLDEFNKLHNRNIQIIEQDAMEMLVNYEWPGNIRELRNLIESLVILSSKDRISKEDIPSYIKKEEKEKVLTFSIGKPLEEVEKLYILSTLNETLGNKRKAAKLLKIGLKTLYRKLEKWK